MLEFLGLENYKNLILPDNKVHLKNLNILLGSNGSGKSNFVSCLQFLNNSLTIFYDDNSSFGDFKEAITKIGDYRILDINSEKDIQTVEFTYCFSLEMENFPNKFFVLNFAFIGMRAKQKIFLSTERLYNTNNPNQLMWNKDDPNQLMWNKDDLCFLCTLYSFRSKEVDKGNIAIYKSGVTDRKIDFKTLKIIDFETLDIPQNALGFLALPILLENSNSSLKNIPAYQVRNELIKEISGWKFYNSNNMDLYKIRTAEPKLGLSDIFLSSSGDNLPLVMENLSQDLDFEDSINIAMKSILPQTRKVRSARSGRLSLTVEWLFEGNKESFYLDEMSDGTVRMLCWATILLSPHLPTLLVIDEPELGLHVAWMPILAEWIKQAAQRTQIIITTHSPDLLDHFTDCLENVLCFQRKDNQHFTINPLDTTALQPKLEEGWELGDLYRVGDPSVGGWPW